MGNITLIGMPGSGKSTIGVVLAKTLGMDFVDTDLLIQRRERRLLQEILNSDGLERFLDIEAEVICGLTCDKSVIAPGGSVICRARAARHLRQLGMVIYIKLPCAEINRRLHNIKTRGIAAMPGQTIEDIYRQRIGLYEKYADIIIDAGDMSVEQLVSEIMNKV